jgi:hypothetical protein
MQPSSADFHFNGPKAVGNVIPGLIKQLIQGMV